MKITEDFIIALKKKDNQAWVDIFPESARAIYNFASSFFNNEQDIEDTVQDVFIKKYEEIENYEPFRGRGRLEQNFFCWIRVNTVHLCINKNKKWGRIIPLSQLSDAWGLDEGWEEPIDEELIDKIQSCPPTQEKKLVANEINEIIGLVIDFIDKGEDLSDEDRDIICEIIKYRFWDELSWKEIGKKLHINTNSVKTKYTRKIKLILAYLKNKNIDPSCLDD